MEYQSHHIETLVLHAGSHRHDPSTNSVAVPIHQTSYQFDDTEHAEAVRLAGIRVIYTRIMNPQHRFWKNVSQRWREVRQRFACRWIFRDSVSYSEYSLCRRQYCCFTHLYGGTYNLFTNTLPKMGIEVRFADTADIESFARLSDDRTRAYFGETLPNPKLIPFPISEVANLGIRRGIPLIVDNTAAPLTCRPIDHGAAIIVHSLTKFIGGHGTSIGGVIIDSGTFDWVKKPAQQPHFNEPDGSYHGAVWGTLVPEALGAPIAYAIRARVVLLRDLGAALSPTNAFHLIQGLETLPLRFREHQGNAANLAAYLKQHGAVSSVIYPQLFIGTDKSLADKYLTNGYGALLG